MISEAVQRVIDHIERHKGRERAMFSIAGLQAVLEENARLRRGLERLASPEAFTVPRMTNEEERARMFYAEAVLRGEEPRP